MTALRQRFIQDLQLAGLAERTCEAYVRAVRQLADHCRQSPGTLTEAQVRDYFSYVKNERRFARGSLTIVYSAIKLFFRRTVPRDWKTLEHLRVPPQTKLPDVLTIDEVHRIIATVRSVPCSACLWTFYSLGLRLAEGVSLHGGDIDAARALSLAENAAARDAFATAAREQAASTATRAVTEPTCAHCGSRLRVVEVVFHRVGFRDSG